ncbi:MAG: hypothetical protein ABIP79_03785 [Chitinophagaceae bacterium]
MFKIYFLFISVLFISCSSKLHYIGQKYSPVTNVEVFVAESSIKKPYTIIGKGYMSRFGFFNNPEKIQEKVLDKGRSIGADAVMIIDYYIPDTGGTVINTVVKTDSLGKGIITAGNTTITPTSSSGYSIIYVKYK